MKIKAAFGKIADRFWKILPEDILLAGVFVVIFLYLVYISPIFLANYLTPCQGQLFGAIIGLAIADTYIIIRKCKFQKHLGRPKFRFPRFKKRKV